MPKKLFKKGHPGGPGRPSLPKELRVIRNIQAKDFEDMLSVLFKATLGEVATLEQDSSAPTLNRIVAKILADTFESGNTNSLGMLLDRVIGPVKQKIAHEFLKPSILEKRDGTVVEFSLTRIVEDDGSV